MKNTTLILFGVLLAACCVAYAFVSVDVDRSDVQLAGAEAARGLSKQFRGKYLHKLVRVVKAKTQDLAAVGVDYRMDVIVGMTKCLRAEEVADIDDCEFQDNVSTYKKCDVLVRRDTDGHHELITSGCTLASRNEI